MIACKRNAKTRLCDHPECFAAVQRFRAAVREIVQVRIDDLVFEAMLFGRLSAPDPEETPTP